MKSRSATALAPVVRDKLAKLLGLTGSDHNGEVVNAARLANRLVRDLGITWFDVLAAPPLDPAHQPQPEPLLDLLRDWPVRWQSAARFCADCGAGVIRDKDIAFATKVSSYTHRPSESQLTWLRDITERVLTGAVS